MTTTLAGAASGTAVRTHRRDAQRADRAGRAATPETHGAGAVAAIAGTLALSLPAVALLDRPAGTATVDVVASFLLVGGLEVVAARALWRLTRGHAHPAAYAALLARLGYALLLVVGALVLLVQGPAGRPRSVRTGGRRSACSACTSWPSASRSGGARRLGGSAPCCSPPAAQPVSPRRSPRSTGCR